jgi:hypothetical protein
MPDTRRGMRRLVVRLRGEKVWHVQTVGRIKKAGALPCSSQREGAFILH